MIQMKNKEKKYLSEQEHDQFFTSLRKRYKVKEIAEMLSLTQPAVYVSIRRKQSTPRLWKDFFDLFEQVEALQNENRYLQKLLVK